MRYRIIPQLYNTKQCNKSMKKLQIIIFRINRIYRPSLVINMHDLCIY